MARASCSFVICSKRNVKVPLKLLCPQIEGIYPFKMVCLYIYIIFLIYNISYIVRNVKVPLKLLCPQIEGIYPFKMVCFLYIGRIYIIFLIYVIFLI